MGVLHSKGLKELERASHWPVIKAALMPRLVVPPTGYPSPKHLIWGVLCSLNGHYEATHRDKTVRPEATPDALWQYAVVCEAAALWGSHMGPVFFLEKNLTEMLAHTTPPQGVKWEELRAPFPSFGLILPETYPTPLLLVSQTKNAPPPWPEATKNALKKLHGRFRTDTIDTNLMDVFDPARETGPWPRKAEDYLTILKGSTDSFWGKTICGTEAEELNKILTEFSDYVEETPEENTGIKNREADTQELRLVMNLLCWLKYEHKPWNRGEWEAKLNEPAPEKPLAKRGFTAPILLRDPQCLEQKPTSAATGNTPGKCHASPIPHWRRGHWHSVLHGPKKTLLRRQWFRPVLVNPNP